MPTRNLLASLVAALAVTASAPATAWAQVTLKLGDVLVAEPGTASISVVDATTAQKTLISQGGLLNPANKAVSVALARDGDVIVAHRELGLIRINPASGVQSILSEGGMFRDPWAIAINHTTGDIYVADSGYDNDRPEINEAGKIIRVNPTTGVQTLVATGSACTSFPAGHACQNPTSAGSYLSHPYGIAIDFSTAQPTLVVGDMGSFAGKGAIIRINPSTGAQTLVWGPSTAVPAPQVSQQTPLGCPMGVAVEPNGNILTSVFMYPVPSVPTFPAPQGTFYGCAPPGIYRINLANNTQQVVNANAPQWQPNTSYVLGDVIRDGVGGAGYVHRVVTSGVSQGAAPSWNTTVSGNTSDGSVVWQNLGLGANWMIPFGMDIEPAPTPQQPSKYNMIVGEEGYSMLFRLEANGAFAPSGAPLAADTSNATSVDVITFTPVGGFKTEPVRSNGQPTGILPPSTTQTTLSLTTNVAATCRYSTSAGVAYGSMPFTFSSTGSTSHSTTRSGLTSGTGYTFYVRCLDQAGNPNSNDYPISFVVAQQPIATPVAAYGFEDGNGSTADDDSNNGHDAEISGATWTSQGRFGDALSFDGTNDSLSVGASSLLTLTTGMTLEAWVYPTSSTGTRDVIVMEGDGHDIYNLYGRNWQGVPETNVFVNGNNQTVHGAEIPVNVWTHLAGTFDGAVLKLFVNGTQVSSKAVPGAIGGSAEVLRIGGNSLWGEFFQGRIDEVRIYNRALTPSEISADMNTPVQGSGGGSGPIRFNGQPSGTLPGATTQVTMSLQTNQGATCKYSTSSGTSYTFMPSTFSTTGGTTHSTTISGLTPNTTRTYYVRCRVSLFNTNSDDYAITFSVAGLNSTASNFAGTESPLFENGSWESAGSGWADMAKSNGAYAPGANGAARVATPVIGGDQYSQITYDQDPGSGSWVGVMTRTDGDGSGYLAIAFAGEVRLYRADYTGSLNFTQLAGVAANIGTAPRRLRLESQGNTHRVFFNGAQVINHVASGTLYTVGQPGIAASVFGGPTVRVLTFEGGDIGAADITAPFRSNGQPTGSLAFGTTQTAISLTTNENATCRYSQSAGVSFTSMTLTFSSTGSTSHSTTVSGLTAGGNYTYYVRCRDTANNANTNDFPITFSVATATTFNSSFTGAEGVLSENGTWDSPGSWADLSKNDGAFTGGMNAAARLVAPAMGSNQYAEMTYDQDPGSGTWVGVMTRLQGASSGSGYLAIAYSGGVHLYRTDDSGGLSFTLLASATANLGAGDRRLRLESSGNQHRVFFNGAQLINHTASGTVYSGGQPGLAASVFGGPQVKALTFQAGNVAP